MRACTLFAILSMLLCAAVALAQKYTGPRPPKADVLYLLHADNLIPAEVVEAHEETKKNEVTYTIPGAGSSAKTPMAEPIFLFLSEKIQPQSLELYKVDIRSGHRETTMSLRRTRGGAKPLRLSVTRLDKGLYKIEADQELENGQYAISPNGANIVFCFEVY